MKKIYFLLVVGLIGCNNPQKKQDAKIKQDSVLVGTWESPNVIITDLWIYQKQGKYYLKELYNDKTEGVEEMIPKELATGMKLTYKNGGFGNEYLLIDNDKNLRWFSSDDRQFAKTEPK